MNDLESLRSALLDMYDVESALSDDALNQPKDSDGTDIRVRDCINDEDNYRHHKEMHGRFIY